MIRMIAWLALACVAGTVSAEPPSKIARPTGTWKHQAGDYLVTFAFEDGTLHGKVANTAESNSVEFDAAYGITREGVLFAIMTKVERKGIEACEKGDMFSFQYKQEGDKLTISKVKAEHAQAGEILEGVYLRK